MEIRSQSQARIFATFVSRTNNASPSNQSPLIVARWSTASCSAIRSFVSFRSFVGSFVCSLQRIVTVCMCVWHSSRELNHPLNFNFDWNAFGRKIGEIVDRYRGSGPDIGDTRLHYTRRECPSEKRSCLTTESSLKIRKWWLGVADLPARFRSRIFIPCWKIAARLKESSAFRISSWFLISLNFSEILGLTKRVPVQMVL